jgi:hypothetical protein
LNHDPLDLCLLSSWNYRHVSSHLAPIYVFLDVQKIAAGEKKFCSTKFSGTLFHPFLFVCFTIAFSCGSCLGEDKEVIKNPFPPLGNP